MDERVLRELGLTKTEIKLYLALLKLGQSTTTPIIREAGIHAAKVYEYLDKLVEKGLVSYSLQSNRKHFTAASPKVLLSLIRDERRELAARKDRVERLLPELDRLRQTGKDAIFSETYEGLKGVKTIYEKILSTLKRGGTQYIIGAPRIGNERIEGYLLEWHERRIKKGIQCKYIYDSNVRDYGEVRERMAKTDVRYLPRKVISPVWIEVFGDNVVIGHIKGFNAMLLLIQDGVIAKSYLDYFKLLWRISKPVRALKAYNSWH